MTKEKTQEKLDKRAAALRNNLKRRKVKAKAVKSKTSNTQNKDSKNNEE